MTDEQLLLAQRLDIRGRSKVSYEAILLLYRTPLTIDQVADQTGLNRASIHERLQKLGAVRTNSLTDAEKTLIKELYQQGFVNGDGKLAALAAKIARPKPSICRYAREAGLTDKGRTNSDNVKSAIGEKAKLRIQENGHPKGMLGKKHSADFKAKQSKLSSKRWAAMTPEQREAQSDKSFQGRVSNGSLYSKEANAAKKSWRAAWREIGGLKLFYRSRWEANYARVLQWQLEQGQILGWEHEPETFYFDKEKRGCRSCLPDFRVWLADGSREYHEVKGWLDERSKTKIGLMAKYYSHITFKIIDEKWFKENPSWRTLLPDWE